MKHLDSLHNWFSINQPYIEAIYKRVKSDVEVFCYEEHFAYVGRLKSIESVSQKLETGRYQRVTDLDDLVAFTIIVPSLTSEPLVIARLNSLYDKVYFRDRNSQKKATEFRFENTRLYFKVRPDYSVGLTPLNEIIFEIQVVTAFEYAWQIRTHDLAYKSPTLSWGRFRLAAMLRALVEQADTVIDSYEDLAKVVDAHRDKSLKQKVLVMTYVKSLFENEFFLAEDEPIDYIRFVDSLHSLLSLSTFAKKDGSINCKAFFSAFENHARAVAPFDRTLTPYQVMAAFLVHYHMKSEHRKEVRLPRNMLLERAYPSVSETRNVQVC